MSGFDYLVASFQRLITRDSFYFVGGGIVLATVFGAPERGLPFEWLVLALGLAYVIGFAVQEFFATARVVPTSYYVPRPGSRVVRWLARMNQLPTAELADNGDDDRGDDAGDDAESSSDSETASDSKPAAKGTRMLRVDATTQALARARETVNQHGGLALTTFQQRHQNDPALRLADRVTMLRHLGTVMGPCLIVCAIGLGIHAGQIPAPHNKGPWVMAVLTLALGVFLAITSWVRAAQQTILVTELFRRHEDGTGDTPDSSSDDSSGPDSGSSGTDGRTSKASKKKKSKTKKNKSKTRKVEKKSDDKSDDS